MRTVRSFTVENPEDFKARLLAWSQPFREIAWLDSNGHESAYSRYDAVLAADGFTSVKTGWHGAFEALHEYRQATRDWLFGYLSYDLKNDTEDLQSENFDGLGFPDLFFFQPKKLFLLNGNIVEFQYLNLCDDEIAGDFEDIQNAQPPTTINQRPVQINQRISKPDYLSKVGEMKAHIHRGDIYEANFCMEFFAGDAAIDPLETYSRLNAISEPPFACFFRNHRQFALCASPERYLRKDGNGILSQPIKGTARRSDDVAADGKLKADLSASEKERAENIMIADLVRNDLSRTAEKDSVKVAELCGLHTFKQVHHLVSSVVSKSTKNPVEILKTTFPMGSMTGAPKISAMKIIEALEETKRGLYSGAMGYFTPGGDFDFNVVIRTILYNAERQYVSFSVGSAITALSDPEMEFEECLVKAAAMRKVLGNAGFVEGEDLGNL
jgi:para-aminobenzoate synthetase component 1